MKITRTYSEWNDQEISGACFDEPMPHEIKQLQAFATLMRDNGEKMIYRETGEKIAVVEIRQTTTNNDRFKDIYKIEF